MRYLKTYENTEYDYLIDKFCVYYYGGELCFTLIKEITVKDDIYVAIGLDYKKYLSNWANYRIKNLEIKWMKIVDTFDTFAEAEECYEMIENAESYNL